MRALSKRIFLASLLIFIVAGGYFAFSLWGRNEALPEGLIQANGRIEGNRVTVARKFAGRIQTLSAREGDKVTAGQVLVQMDDAQTRTREEQAQAQVTQMQIQVIQARQAVAAVDARLNAARTVLATLKKEIPLTVETAEADVARARAAVSKAEAAERQARRDAERFRALAERGSVGKQRGEQADSAWTLSVGELESARAALAQAQAILNRARLGVDRITASEEEMVALEAERKQALSAVERADAGLSQAEAVLAEAKSVRTDLTISASAGGVIATRARDVGEVVSPGSPIFELIDLDRLYLEVYVPETMIGKLRLGLPARVYVDTFPERPFAATVRYIASRAEFTPREVHTQDERVKLVY
ncbi:MAG: efflux RND transporter periplasmic adaptor subunit, partial [Blastocatellia bacterium]|nr:efflux RND transporter periplasmic adaptor subunit [Blastocatellia bacterium]